MGSTTRNHRADAIGAALAYLVAATGCVSSLEPPRAYFDEERSVDVCTIWATHTDCYKQSMAELEQEMERENERVEMAEQYRFDD